MSNQRGFTILEILVAVLVLTIGLLALVSTAAMTTRMIGQGQRYSEASAYASQRFEILRSQKCADMTDGSSTYGRFGATWTVSSVANGNAQQVLVVVSSPSPRGAREDTFVTTIPC